METTWHIRPTALWHDGTAFTAADVLFSATLARDRDLAIFRHRAMDAVEKVEAPDARTVVVTWKQPYIQADSLFTRRIASLRPRHVLESAYLENKESVTQLPYWTDQYVGAGPFRVRQFSRSSYLVLEANDQYVLGRPKIDEIEVRFIPNSNALGANILAGEVELTLGRNLSLQQAVQLRDQWQNGIMAVGIKNWIALHPQFLNPNPPILLELPFRRALVHAIDRQQLVDTLQAGVVPVAHSFLSPTEPAYQAVQDRIVRYDYDPRRAVELIEGLGYVRGADGVFRDLAGRPLALDVRTSAEDDTHEAGTFTAADYFKRVGIAAEAFLIPQAQRDDREFNANFPGVRFWRQGNDTDDIRRYHSSEASLAENRFSGSNRGRYMNPELDALVDRYMTTIPLDERNAVLGDVIHHMTDQVVIIGLWYNTEPVLIGKRLKNVMVRDIGGTTEAWNAHMWDVS